MLKMISIPSWLTIARVLVIPPFIYLYLLDAEWSGVAASLLFVVAALTDWLDGYLARRWQQESDFGAFLDPVADKLLVISALVLLAVQFNSAWMTVLVLLLILREVVVSALREWMATSNRSEVVRVGLMGKLKTMVQMVAITLLLSGFLTTIGAILLGVATVLSLYSMYLYLSAARYELI